MALGRCLAAPGLLGLARASSLNRKQGSVEACSLGGITRAAGAPVMRRRRARIAPPAGSAVRRAEKADARRGVRAPASTARHAANTTAAKPVPAKPRCAPNDDTRSGASAQPSVQFAEQGPRRGRLRATLAGCGSASGLPPGARRRVSSPAATRHRRLGLACGDGRAGRGLRERLLCRFELADLLLQRGNALVDAFGEFGDCHHPRG